MDEKLEIWGFQYIYTRMGTENKKKVDEINRDFEIYKEECISSGFNYVDFYKYFLNRVGIKLK